MMNIFLRPGGFGVGSGWNLAMLVTDTWLEVFDRDFGSLGFYGLAQALTVWYVSVSLCLLGLVLISLQVWF